MAMLGQLPFNELNHHWSSEHSHLADKGFTSSVTVASSISKKHTSSDLIVTSDARLTWHTYHLTLLAQT